MKFNILKPALAALVLVGTACTANYLDINTNPYEPSEDDMQTDGYIIGSALTSLASTVVSTDVNTAQFTDVLLGGPMGGYYSTTGGFTRTIMNYNPTDDWTNVFMYSDRTIPVLYSNLRELKKVTDDPIVLAIADIIKVAAMHRVTDTYGPIPYSMIGENGQIQVPYDSQEKVYDKFFEELDAAIKCLPSTARMLFPQKPTISTAAAPRSGASSPIRSNCAWRCVSSMRTRLKPARWPNRP